MWRCTSPPTSRRNVWECVGVYGSINSHLWEPSYQQLIRIQLAWYIGVYEYSMGRFMYRALHTGLYNTVTSPSCKNYTIIIYWMEHSPGFHTFFCSLSFRISFFSLMTASFISVDVSLDFISIAPVKQLQNVKMTPKVHCRPFICLICLVVRKKETTPSHENTCQSIVQKLLSPWKCRSFVWNGCNSQ